MSIESGFLPEIDSLASAIIVRLAYRTYVRQNQNVSLALDEIKNRLDKIFRPGILQYKDPIDSYVQIKVEDVRKAQERGLFVTEHVHDAWCVVVRELPIEYRPSPTTISAEKFVSTIFHYFPKTFAVIAIEQQFLTEVAAI